MRRGQTPRRGEPKRATPHPDQPRREAEKTPETGSGRRTRTGLDDRGENLLSSATSASGHPRAQGSPPPTRRPPRALPRPQDGGGAEERSDEAEGANPQRPPRRLPPPTRRQKAPAHLPQPAEGGHRNAAARSQTRPPPPNGGEVPRSPRTALRREAEGAKTPRNTLSSAGRIAPCGRPRSTSARRSTFSARGANTPNVPPDRAAAGTRGNINKPSRVAGVETEQDSTAATRSATSAGYYAPCGRPRRTFARRSTTRRTPTQ